MKILLTHRFFWPDTSPYSSFLRSIGLSLLDAGHDVHTFSSTISYRDNSVHTTPCEAYDGLQVNRIAVFHGEKNNILKRLANVFIYCGGLFFEIFRLRPDVVTASTYPPVIAAWCASFAAQITHTNFIYHIQDIHPEISIISGGHLGRGLLMRFMRLLDNQTLRRCAAIIVLSEDMAKTLLDRDLGELPIHVINNLSLNSASSELDLPPVELRKSAHKRRIIFAGNLGRFQQLPLIAEGVSRLFDKYPELELVFLGDGALLAELKSCWEGHPQVSFIGFIPFDQARVLIEEADIGLVSLLPGIYRAAYPSKVLSYAGLGLPMLALVEPESQIANELCKYGIGKVPKEPTPHAVAESLDQMLSCPISPSKVYEWHDRVAGQGQILPRWHSLMKELEGQCHYR